MADVNGRRVAVCIASCRRPEGLLALLGALEGQRFSRGTPALQVVVVDNDPAGSARAICDDAGHWLSWPLTYLQEKRPGIPMARNAGVGVCWDADWIAFVDDDEVPDPDWLDTLLEVQRAEGADVVAGPVLVHFERPPPEWVRAGRFLEHEAYDAAARSVRTGNVLVRTACLARLPSLFDERMRPMGEDRELFERVLEGGARLAWAPGARVLESVPPERARLGWILRRGFRVGVAASRIASIRGSRLRAAPRAVAHGLWCLVRGLARAVGTPVGGRAAGAAGLRLAAFGLGRWAGLLGPRRFGLSLRNRLPGAVSA